MDDVVPPRGLCVALADIANDDDVVDDGLPRVL